MEDSTVPPNARTRRRQGGFTQFELAQSLSIIAILIGLLLPAVQKVRMATNKAAVQDTLKAIVNAEHFFWLADKDQNGLRDYTADLKVLSNVGGLHDNYLAVGGRKFGYRFKLKIIKGGLFKWQGTATPLSPGITGDMTFTVDQTGIIQSAPTPGAAQGADTLRQQATNEVIRLVSLGTTDEARHALGKSKTTLEADGSVSKLIGLLDTNGDGQISYEEIVGADVLSLVRKANAQDVGGVRPLDAPPDNTVVGDDADFNAILAALWPTLNANLNLGAANENLNAPPALNLAVLQRDPPPPDLSDSFIQSVQIVIGVDPGDLDGDGNVTAADVVRAVQIFLGLRVPTTVEMQAADVRPKPGLGNQLYGDQKVAADDLNWLIRRFLQLETSP